MIEESNTKQNYPNLGLSFKKRETFFIKNALRNVQKITSAFERLFLIDYFLEKNCVWPASYTTLFQLVVNQK